MDFDIVSKIISAFPYFLIGVIYAGIGGLIINYPDAVINPQLGTGITIIAFGFAIFILGIQTIQPTNKELLKEITELKELLKKEKK